MVHLPCLRSERTHREGGESLSHIFVAMKLQATDHGSTTDAPRIVCATCIYAEEGEGPLSAVGGGKNTLIRLLDLKLDGKPVFTGKSRSQK